MNESIKSEMRYCADIGMWAIDRKIADSCIFKTATCERECFNNKLFDVYKNMHKKDVRNEAYWASVTGTQFAQHYARKRTGKESGRFRFMTRGETFDSVESVKTARDIVVNSPDVIFWIPTRAWRDLIIGDGEIYRAIEANILPLKNVRLLASMDDSNTEEEWQYVTKILRLSTMYFDGNKAPENTPAGNKYFKCPKTHKHLKGHCGICKAGCFNDKKRVDVHLLKH